MKYKIQSYLPGIFLIAIKGKFVFLINAAVLLVVLLSATAIVLNQAYYYLWMERWIPDKTYVANPADYCNESESTRCSLSYCSIYRPLNW
jgi:hypothetical protein